MGHEAVTGDGECDRQLLQLGLRTAYCVTAGLSSLTRRESETVALRATVLRGGTGSVCLGKAETVALRATCGVCTGRLYHLRTAGWERLWPAGICRLARRSLGQVGHYHGVRHTPVLFNPIQSNGPCA